MAYALASQISLSEYPLSDQNRGRMVFFGDGARTENSRWSRPIWCWATEALGTTKQTRFGNLVFSSKSKSFVGSYLRKITLPPIIFLNEVRSETQSTRYVGWRRKRWITFIWIVFLPGFWLCPTVDDLQPDDLGDDVLFVWGRWMERKGNRSHRSKLARLAVY